MKKIFNLVALLGIMTLMLTSCNRDERISWTLDGIWEGEVATEYFSHRWQEVVVQYQSVDIEFYADSWGGRGRGIEYDYTGYDTYYACEFYYEVRNGRIYLDYDDGSRMMIDRDYYLTNRVFEGNFCDYRTGEFVASFKFYKVAEGRYRATRSGEPMRRLSTPFEK